MPLAYLLGGGFALASRDGKRLGDMAAGTIVVQERARPTPEAIVPPGERHNSFLARKEVVVRVIGRVNLEERELLLDLALRREQLPLDKRLWLFEGLAEHFQEKLGIEKPSYFSDERYCLNIAAVLLQAGAKKSSGHEAEKLSE